MKEVRRSFDDLESLIDNLKSKDSVVGIVEYGGRTFTDMNLGGDYDLTVILDKPISSNFNGLHLHVAGIPTDCMVLSVDDFMEETPQNPFYMAHLNATILYDKDNMTKDLMDRIKHKWQLSKTLSDSEKHLFRFSFQHILDKLEHRLEENPLYSRFFIFASFDWYLSCYGRINNLEVGKPKLHLDHIKLSDEVLYGLISDMYAASDLHVQYHLLRKCAEKIIEPIGGLWRKGEVLLHLLPGGSIEKDEEDAVLDLLLG